MTAVLDGVEIHKCLIGSSAARVLLKDDDDEDAKKQNVKQGSGSNVGEL